jgi:hypothetical protein
MFAGFTVLSSMLFALTSAIWIRAQFAADSVWVSCGQNSLTAEPLRYHLMVSGFHWPDGLKNEQGSGYYRFDPSPSRDGWYTSLGSTTVNLFVVGIPYWSILLVSTPAPAMWMIKRRNLSKRRTAGQCLACGYDLRATPERCPECGAIAARVASG